MASDAVILLPGEIIGYILEDRNLDFSDVVNFSLTCKHLYKIVNESNRLWKTKLFQRWPLLKEVYQMCNESGYQVLNWKEEVKASLNSRNKLIHHLSLMSNKFYKQRDLSNSDFKEYDPLFHPEEGSHPLAYYFLVDELISFIKCPAMVSNLTHRYYALKVLRCLKQCHLKKEWQKFTSLPSKEQTLERGATIVAQWSQPERHVSYSYISSLLDNIAEQTKELLKEQYPGHSIFSTPSEQFTHWKNHIIDDNQWSTIETRQITDALCKVLFEKLGFYGNSNMYFSSENSFIDRVLEQKHGIPITLAIVFESVARRLGIKCEPVSFPSHFLLRWKETYGPESKDLESFYIDVFNGGQFLTKKNCPRVGGVSKCPIEKYNTYESASAVEVISRIASNLQIAARQYVNATGRATRLRSALELQHLLQPYDTNTILQLGRLYALQDMDLTELVNILGSIEKNLELTSKGEAAIISKTLQKWQERIKPKEEIVSKKREPGVLYAIGLIMQHNIHGYLCVINGWDSRWMRSEQLMSELSEYVFDDADCQPFYNVLADDGSFLYAAQENLSLTCYPKWINHDAIGKYFCKFNGTHYVPNEEKAREYPEDEAVRNKLLRMFKQNENSYDTT